jgi:hypothetical protein
MTSDARGPFPLRGALVRVPASGGSPQTIAFQYNPATLRRTLQPEMVGGEEQDRSQAVRFVGAPVQTIAMDVEIDATDRLNKDDSTAVRLGINPELAALELLVYPSSRDVNRTASLLASGTIEVAPLTADRTLLVWSQRRVLPVRLSRYSITEEAFDARLNPIRATVSLEMRVLNYTDLASTNPDYHLFMAYQQAMETIAGEALNKSPTSTTGVNVGTL